jgi:hypothetical protein
MRPARRDQGFPEAPADLVFFFFVGGVGGAAAVSVDDCAGALEAGASSPDVAARLEPTFRSYPSEYQPPPFRWKAEAEISLVTLDRHFGHRASGRSAIDCS